MKTFLRFPKLGLLIVMLTISGYLCAQTPQFYNYNNGTSGNSFPLNKAPGKMVQWLIPVGNFTQPTPATAGNITKLYFFVKATDPLSSTYTDFKIMLKQTTDSLLVPGAFLTDGWDTVYKRTNVELTAAGGTWLMFTLDHPFTFDPTKSLAIQMEQCSSTQSTGYSLQFTLSPGNRRFYSVGGCPFVYSGVSTDIPNVGFDVVSAAFTLPDLIYYRFENNPAPNLTPNFAIPGSGTNPAPLTTLTLNSGGQFDSCLFGTATSSAKIMTGYNLATGTSSFTISMWLSNLVTPATTRYLFGDMGHSFRCFVGGAAPSGGAILRGTGMTEVPINNIFPGPTVVHIVYDSATTSIKVYKNGVLDNTVVQAAPLDYSAGTGFSVGGYSSSAGIDGSMDEFRFYKRGLDAAEIAATWNLDIGLITSVNPIVSNVPDKYSLSQNYPNPFNPVTKINFTIPKSGLVTLRIYDVLGREVSTLVNEIKNAGTYKVYFNGSSLSSGMYFYKVSVNGFTDVKKMMLIK
ncbi:MAG: LamG-like jellyroll fold domain-containing protein [Candidatus Kapaibacterium sp.]